MKKNLFFSLVIIALVIFAVLALHGINKKKYNDIFASIDRENNSSMIDDKAASVENSKLKKNSSLDSSGSGSDQNSQADGAKEASSALPKEVLFSGGSFSPATVTVAIGDEVEFKNESEEPLWIVADSLQAANQPKFDSLRGLEKGESYKFKFDEVGEWRYHNRLNPAQEGKVVVK